MDLMTFSSPNETEGLPLVQTRGLRSSLDYWILRQIECGKTNLGRKRISFERVELHIKMNGKERNG